MRYAARRGVRVVPELDSPAHVGAGWEAVDPGFTLCVNKVSGAATRQETQPGTVRSPGRSGAWSPPAAS